MDSISFWKKLRKEADEARDGVHEEDNVSGCQE